jgi:hypothetical protein
MPSAPMPAAAPPKSGKGLKIAGLALLVGGLALAAVMYFLQKGAHEDSIKNLARTVPNFDNKLQFDSTGVFNVYYEYQGTASASVNGKAQNFPLNGPVDPPAMDVTLTDSGGKTVALSSVTSTARYDAAGYKGVAFKQVNIKKAGEFTLSIVPKNAKDNNFALAIGKTEIKDQSLLLPLILGAGGLLLGGLALMAGSRKPKTATAPVTPAPIGYPGVQQPAGYPQPYQQPGFQQPGGYPPAPAPPYGGQPTYPPAPYQQPSFDQPTQQYGGPAPYQQPSFDQPTQQYGGPAPYQQPSYDQPTQQYGQQPPVPQYGDPQQPPPAPQYGHPAEQPAPPPPPPPPAPGGWAAPDAPSR